MRQGNDRVRPQFATRRILLRSEQQRGIALALIAHLPLDDQHPLELLVREPVKVRTPSQNSLMWSGPLKDIAEQAWADERQYSAKVWHRYFKGEYLPEEDATDLHELVKDPFKWCKWDYNPAGEREVVGSTTDLTKKGFSQYLEQVYAYGASLGVQFNERGNL